MINQWEENRDKLVEQRLEQLKSEFLKKIRGKSISQVQKMIKKEQKRVNEIIAQYQQEITRRANEN